MYSPEPPNPSIEKTKAMQKKINGTRYSMFFIPYPLSIGCKLFMYPSHISQELHQELNRKGPHQKAEPGPDHFSFDLHADSRPEISTDENGNASY